MLWEDSILRPEPINLRSGNISLKRAKPRFQITVHTHRGDKGMKRCVGHMKKAKLYLEICKNPGNIMGKSWNLSLRKSGNPGKFQCLLLELVLGPPDFMPL